MALKKSEKKMLIFLGVVVIGAVIYQFVIFPGQQKKEQAEAVQRQPAANRTAQVRTPAQAPQPQASPVSDIPITIPEQWGDDPFRVEATLRRRPVESEQVMRTAPASRQPGAAAAAPVQPEMKPPVLQGVYQADGKARALIDNVLLSEGEQKEGITLVSIGDNEVICRKNNRTFTLRRR